MEAIGNLFFSDGAKWIEGQVYKRAANGSYQPMSLVERTARSWTGNLPERMAPVVGAHAPAPVARNDGPGYGERILRLAWAGILTGAESVRYRVVWTPEYVTDHIPQLKADYESYEVAKNHTSLEENLTCIQGLYSQTKRLLAGARRLHLAVQVRELATIMENCSEAFLLKRGEFEVQTTTMLTQYQRQIEQMETYGSSDRDLYIMEEYLRGICIDLRRIEPQSEEGERLLAWTHDLSQRVSNLPFIQTQEDRHQHLSQSLDQLEGQYSMLQRLTNSISPRELATQLASLSEGVSTIERELGRMDEGLSGTLEERIKHFRKQLVALEQGDQHD